MKKTTAFFLTIGVLAMISGGIGSLFFYNRVGQNIAAKNSYEEYTLKNKSTSEAHLKLEGNSDFLIQLGDSNTITMESQNSRLSSLETALNVDESEGKVSIEAKSSMNHIKINDINIGFFDGFDSYVIITVPTSIKNLVIDGNAPGNITISGLDTNSLSIKFPNADLSLQTITADTINASTNSGDMYLDQIKAETTLTTQNGDISASNISGTLNTSITNGDFSLSGKEFPNKLTAKTSQGDISIYPDVILYDISIKAKSTLGDVQLFDKERTTYKEGKEKTIFDLESRMGDIYVVGPGDYFSEDD